jgi:putative transposase
VGIDLGIHSFCTLSTGDKIAGPKAYIKEEKKLKRAQRKLSRMEKGSANYEKQRIIVAKINERIANIRNDWQHKMSLSLVRDFDVICAEDLSVKKMLHKNRYAKYLADAAWGAFLNKLEYKAQWYGKTFIKIDRYFASSQTCSECGHKEPALKDLRVRKWICPECGAHHDRDINAAVNILNEGLRVLS